MALTSDSHRAVDQGHSPREDRKIRERLRKCTSERRRVELPLKEEDDVDRQVRDNGVADIAADFEPLCGHWSDQLSRHNGLRSAVHCYAAAEFRGVGDSPEIRLLIGGGIGLDQVPAVQRVLRAAGVEIEWDEHFAGAAALERGRLLEARL